MDLKFDENENLRTSDVVYPTTEVLEEISSKIIEENIQAYEELAK